MIVAIFHNVCFRSRILNAVNWVMLGGGTAAAYEV